MSKTSVNNIVASICSNECAGCVYKATCKRGSWHKPAFALGTPPKSSTDTECPLMQCDIEKVEKRKDITVDDTWQVCAKCKFAKVKADTIDIGNCYEDHCIDCIVCRIRDGIEENEAEARWS